MVLRNVLIKQHFPIIEFLGLNASLRNFSPQCEHMFCHDVDTLNVGVHAERLHFLFQGIQGHVEHGLLLALLFVVLIFFRLDINNTMKKYRYNER